MQNKFGIFIGIYILHNMNCKHYSYILTWSSTITLILSYLSSTCIYSMTYTY